MKVIWKREQGQYLTYENLYLGKWKIGSVYSDGCTSKSDPNKIAVRCCLPGIKESLGKYETEEQGKAKLEQVAKYWLKEAGYEMPQES